MKVTLSITSLDGETRIAYVQGRRTAQGIKFDATAVGLWNGDRVVWTTSDPELGGFFDVVCKAEEILH